MESYEILWKSALGQLSTLVSSIFYDTFAVEVKPVDIKAGDIIESYEMVEIKR